MKELHSCIIECITHTHTQETRALKQQPRTATSSSKILAGHRHTRLHHGHGGIVYPTEPRSLLTFCHLDLDPSAVTHAALTHHHHRSPQRPKLLPQPCDTFPPPSLSSAYRLLISAGVSSKPVLPPTVHPFSLLLSLLHAITITISPTVYPTVKPRFDKSCSRPGGRKEGVYNSTESSRRNGRKIFAPRIRTPPIESPLPPPPVRNVREITPGDHGIHGSER